MGKNTRLVNIYIKIHNKHTLTIEDLKYLSKYDPECFEKTCKNIVYKMPETKEILQTAKEEPEPLLPIFEKKQPDKQQIQTVLSNLKQMEMKELPIEKVDAAAVKELLGSLYMEMLFPHNDKEKFFNMADNKELSHFNKKV